MPDFNGPTPARHSGARYDEDAIAAALARCAYRWVPELYPQGRLAASEGHKVIRCADVSGRPPRNQGSCVIHLEGEHAGGWYDHSLNHGGGPLSTLKEKLGLAGGAVFEEALRICQECGVSIESTPKPSGHANGHANGDSREERNLRLAEGLLNEAMPLAGSLGETYWQARKLGPLPAAAFNSPDGQPDLRFVPLASNHALATSFPTIIARFRYPWDGTPTGGIHRLYLEPDGSWHIGRRIKGQGKKMLGPTDWGVITLAPPDANGSLGIGEGIESTAAGMAMYGRVGGWAAASNGGMDKLAELIRQGRVTLAGVRHVLVFADRGSAGEKSAWNLFAAVKGLGLWVGLCLPRGGDDPASDLAQGLPPPDPLIDVPAEPQPSSLPAPVVTPKDDSHVNNLGELPTPVPLPNGAAETPMAAPRQVERRNMSFAEIQQRIAELQPGIDGPLLNQVLLDIVNAELAPANLDQVWTALAKRVKIKKAALIDQSRMFHAEIVTPLKSRSLLNFEINSEGEPKNIMANVALALRELPELHGCIGLSEFSEMIHVLRKFPWEDGAGNPCGDTRPWTDADELALLEYIQKVVGIHVTRNVLFDGVQRIAFENKFHPVRDYLNDLVWDKEERIRRWLTYYLGCEDNEYVRAIGARWLISAVARIFRPGCKADCVLILEGPQGLKKSTVFRELANPFFTDDMPELGTKDASLQLRGIWIIELSELDSMKKAESPKIKSFLSRQTDRFRPPYGRVSIDAARQCVIAGTCNEFEYLRDESGGRRFWPVKCIAIDIEALKADRDQLWAEAVYRFNLNERWWIDEDEDVAAEARQHQEERRQTDPWESVIHAWLEGSPEATTKSALQNAIFKPKADWTVADEMRVAKIFRLPGWTEKKRERTSDGLQWVYRKAS